MNINLMTLLRELEKYYSVYGFGLMTRNISGISLLDQSVKLCDNTLYVLSLQGSEGLMPEEKSAPLLCVAPPGTFFDRAALSGRSIIQVCHDDMADVLLTLSKILYECGRGSSELSEFSKTLLSCAGPQQMLDAAFSIMGNPIILTNPVQRILCYAGPRRAPSHTHKQFEELISREFLPFSFVADQLVETSYVNSYLSTWPNIDERGGILRKALTSGEKVEGYLHVFGCGTEIKLRDIEITEILSNFVTPQLLRSDTVKKTVTNDGKMELFLKNLLDSVVESADSTGINLKEYNIQGAMRVLVIRPNADGAELSMSLQSLTETLAAAVTGCFGMIYKNNITLLAGCGSAWTDMGSAFEHLGELLYLYGLTAGVSNAFRSILDYRKHYLQAVKATLLGAAFFKGESFHTYEKCAIYHVIELASAYDDLENFCSPRLKSLIDYNAKTNGDLVNTLKVYLNNGMSKSETAKRMRLHLNTVKYRLSTIEEVLGVDLSAADIANSLHFSFKIQEYVSAFPNPDSSITRFYNMPPI